MNRKYFALITAPLLFACGGPDPASHPPLPRPVATVTATATASAPATAPPPDPLGPRPELATPPPFQPPAPTVYTAANGMTVWLMERHNLPLVSVVLTVPNGSSSDPKGKYGLALATANMLDEGAGTRGPLELAAAIDALGASISTSCDTDASFASLTVLKRNLPAAFALFGDVVARPRFEEKEWKRVHELWKNDLKARASDPSQVARVQYRAALYGTEHPYGHPTDGTVASADKVTLGDAKAFYQASWRPERATLVVVGDVTKDELQPLIDSALGTWKGAGKAAPVVAPPAPSGPHPRLVMVDRPDAPQSIIAVVRAGTAATDPDLAPLSRVNTALGGSFTSRLNQDLREEHGWSYGAGSRVSMTRGAGMIVAQAAVFTDKTGDALKALMADVEQFAKEGLNDEEVAKTRSKARAELVSAYETVDAAAGVLARDAALGLGPDYEAQASVRRDQATKEQLQQLAAKFYDPKDAVVVIVGPRAKIEAQLAPLGLGAPDMRDADGNPIARK